MLNPHHSAGRHPGRGRLSGRAWERRLFELPSHITERDRMICHLLYDHRVLTTSQIADVGFDSPRRAQRRLSLLYDLHVVDRFQRPGAAQRRGVVRPDGFAVWDHHGRRVPFFLEYDNGTETLGRLEAELSGYAKLARAVGHPTWVLFRFPSMGREAHARRVLSHPDVPVATAVLVRLHITSPDIEDETTPPLPFGLGPHHCLGAAWVRMVCRTSCRALVRRYRIHLISATAAEPRHLIPGLSELLVVLQP